ncbi:MAG: hypothetical protein DMG69_00995 [Acidobacteria bacterium]|nr:MAG: hypothetical protein DMG69_00995 [Acidobacteriota bacterium]
MVQQVFEDLLNLFGLCAIMPAPALSLVAKSQASGLTKSYPNCLWAFSTLLQVLPEITTNLPRRLA